MKIAIDCRSIIDTKEGGMAGIGHYTYFLVRHLLKQDTENTYTLFFDGKIKKSMITDILGSNRRAKVVTLKTRKSGKVLPYLHSHQGFAKEVMRGKHDLFHAPTGSLPMGYKGKSVITVHDLAIYLHPEWFPGGQIFSRRVVVPKSIREAERIIAVSASTKRDLMRQFKTPKEKIVVIHEGVEHHVPFEELEKKKEGVLKEHGIKDPYFLYLGTIEPRKNVEGLVAAFERLAKEFPDLVVDTKLILAGSKGWKSEAAFKAIEKANLRLRKKAVRHIGYVDAEDKLTLMAESVAFVFPTRYEGFGLPVLEAMSLGIPVIASETSSIPEITGPDGAMLVEPGDQTELVLAMKHLLEDPDRRALLGRRGLERSTEFSWERAAGETLEVYEDAVREKHRLTHPAADLRHRWIDDTLFDTPHRQI